MDMSLDDVIKMSKAAKGAGGKVKAGGRGGGRSARNQAATPYGARPGGKACNNCGVVGHLAGQCPEPAQCHACGSTAHAVAECPHKSKTCSICGKVGHLKVTSAPCPVPWLDGPR